MATKEVLEERMKNIEKQNTKEHKEIMDELKGIKREFDSLDDTFVTRHEFSPVKAITYGAASLILTSVFGAIVYLVVAV